MNRIPLVKPHLPSLEEIEGELRAMLDSGRLTNFGPFSETLEMKTRDLFGVRCAASVSNATTGLMLLLNTLPAGTEVIVPSFTFLPTVQAILWNGLVPVFADIDEKTLNVSPDSIASRITDRTSAILAVHIFGNPCDIERLEEIARSNRIKLFFDSAHAFGAKRGSRYLGGGGDAEVFSLSATKLLPCGEGGIVTTDDELIHQAILNRRNYGFKPNSRDCSNMGMNGKITEFSAILGVKEIESIGSQVRRRNEIAGEYMKRLGGLHGLEFQSVDKDDVSTYKDFVIMVEPSQFGTDRDDVKRSLNDAGIETEAYFSPSIHQMTYFKGLGLQDTPLPVTESVAGKILSLPIYHDMTETELSYVVDNITRLHTEHRTGPRKYILTHTKRRRLPAAL